MKMLFGFLFFVGVCVWLNVLIFYCVLCEFDLFFLDEVDVVCFDEQFGWIKFWFNVLLLDEVLCCFVDGSLFVCVVVLIFDDGYVDNYDVVLLLLKKYGLLCSFFVVMGFLDGGCMWNDMLIEFVWFSCWFEFDLCGLSDVQGGDFGWYFLCDMVERCVVFGCIIECVKYLLFELCLVCVDVIVMWVEVMLFGDLMMSSEQVWGLCCVGMQIGVYIVSYFIFVILDVCQVVDEIVRSCDVFEGLLGEKVKFFVYLNGKLGIDYMFVVYFGIVCELGFDVVVLMCWVVVWCGEDVFQILCFMFWDCICCRFGLWFLCNLLD